MYYNDYAVVDIPLSAEIEVELIHCFIGAGEMVAFGCAEISNREKAYLESNGVEVGFESVYDDLNPVLFSNELCYDWEMKDKKMKRVSWYVPGSREELVSILKYEGITFRCRILKPGNEAVDYKYELYFFEHHQVECDDYSEHRSMLIEKHDETSTFEVDILPKLQEVIDNYDSSNL